MKRLTLLLTCFIISMGLAIAQQTKQVSGTVLDGSGEPVIGASVIVKGNAAIGTVTDINGKFSLSVPESVTLLVVKFLGMKDQEVQAGSNISVTLLSSESVLDEVIVVAYGTAKKSQFAGSVTVIKADEISKVQTANLTNALVGKVTGMQIVSSSGQPGVTSPTIRVRGIGSINAGSAPLIILDGAPFSGDLNNLNTLDIESITVLKDAVSNALYGARSANGVMLVTTKKGASGKATITVDAKYGLNTRSTQDYKIVKDPSQYYEMYYGALSKYYVNGLKYSPEQAHLLANQNMLGGGDYGLGYNVFNVPKGQTLVGSNGKLNPNATMGNTVTYNGEDYLLMADNWLNEAYVKTIRQEYNFSASSSTDKSSFYASFGYLDLPGIVEKSDFKRITARLKADYQLKPWIKMGANMFYVNRNANSLGEDGSTGSSGNIFAFTTRIAPIYPLYIRDGKGNIKKDVNGFTMYDYGDKGNAGLSRPFLGTTNALGDVYLNTNNGEGNFFNGSGFFDITFLKDFKFSSINSVSMGEVRSTDVTNPYYGQYAPSNGIVWKQHTRSFSYNFQQLLNYMKDLDNHHISLLLGHDYTRDKYFLLNAQKQNMFDPNNHELNGAVSDGPPSSYTTDFNDDAFITRLLYDYDNKYFLNGLYRREASSRFHPDNRWGNFWSAGLAWLLTNESWFNNLSWINMLKLKVSYGELGNDDIGNYRFTDTYTIVNSSGRPAAIPNLKGNKDIKWETKGKFNTGIDFSLFDERLNGEINYYYEKTSDMLFSFPLPPSYGWTSYYANIGDLRNRGVEVDLKGALIRSNDFNWDLSLKLTSNNNKVIFLPKERKTMTISGVNGYQSSGLFYGEGIPLYTFVMKQYAGVNEEGLATYWRDKLDDDGKTVIGREAVTNPSEATDYLCGTALPDIYGGFGTSVSFKGFDFSVDFAYQIGGLVNDSDYASYMVVPQATNKGSNFHADLLNAWTPENTTSNIPRFQFGDMYSAYGSNRFLTDASYLALQNIVLGYTIPKRLCSKLGTEKIRFYTVCDNTWLWSKRQGLDPRQSISGSSTQAYYAPMRIFSGGITVTF